MAYSFQVCSLFLSTVNMRYVMRSRVPNTRGRGFFSPSNTA